MKIITHSFVFERGDRVLLNNEAILKKLLHDIVAAANLTPLNYASHRFKPQGISATLILSESHIAIHTWPEHGSGYVILTSCIEQQNTFLRTSEEFIRQAFKANIRTAKELT